MTNALFVRRILPLALLAGLLVTPVPAIAEDGGDALLAPRADHPGTARQIVALLERAHHRDQDLDDGLSGRLLDRYLKYLDPAKMNFLATDVAEFEALRTKLDDELKTGRLDSAYAIYNLLQKRRVQRLVYQSRAVDAGLDKLDLGTDETLDLNREKSPWPADGKAAEVFWRQLLKSDVLALLLAGRSREEAAVTLGKRYRDQIRRSRQARSRDVFSLYMNALANCWDPHTAYFPPRDAANFDIRMKLSLTGIGAVLTAEGEFTKVERLIAGGPAEKAGDLKAGDLISGVAQGDEGEMVDTIAWRLDEVVDLIRGPKGSVVRLEIRPAVEGAGAKPRTIRIVRDEVKLEDQAAKSRIIEVKSGDHSEKIGIIALPTFYADQAAARRGEENYKSSTRDVARLLTELEKSGVVGIVVDLRGNGGGSLFEAMELTGLFVGARPILEVKDADGRSQVLRGSNAAVYGGPLLVLVDRSSASASEIFAAAIQDYGRGLVVGETTFGKGTVQTIAPLDKGQLKLTRAQFYRITGSSTQTKGVTPDITLPGWIDPAEFGESALDESLPWDQIPPVKNLERLGRVEPIVPKLAERHEARMAADPDFTFFKARHAILEEARKSTLLSLNLEVRKKERETLDKRLLEVENRWRKARGMAEVESPTTPTAEEFDPWATEAANILADAIADR